MRCKMRAVLIRYGWLLIDREASCLAIALLASFLIIQLIAFFAVGITVSSTSPHDNNIHLPDNNVSRSHYAWYILDSDQRYKSIYASRFDNKLSGISTDGVHYTYNGTNWKNSNFSSIGINESLKSENADLNKIILISDSGKVYKMHPYLGVYVDIANSVPNTSFSAVYNSFWNGPVMVYEMMTIKKGPGVKISPLLSFIKKYELNGTDVSCTVWSNTCWYIESNSTVKYFKWNNSLQNAIEEISFNITEDSFVSVTVHENEVWLITTDGRRAWRRLGVTLQNSSGIRWMVIPIYLPYPVTAVSIGLMGIYVVMQGGLIARFQGFEYPTEKRPYNFFEIDTYDDKIVVGLFEIGKSKQSAIVGGELTSYGYLMWLGDKSYARWSYFNGLETTKLKGVAVGENMIYVLKRGKIHDVYEIAGTTLQKYSDLKATSLGVGANGVLYTANNDTESATIQCQRFPATQYGITINTTLHSFVSISCGMLQCWGVNRNGTAVLIKLKSSDVCPNPFPSMNASADSGDDVSFDQIDTDKSGYVWGVEKKTNDVYFRYGANSSFLKGQMWANMPGLMLKDVAVGRDIVYGIANQGQMVYFELKDGNWTAWSKWTDCDADCLGGHRFRERHCNHPAPMYGGKGCFGESQEFVPCNQHNCTVSCIKALDGNGKTRCCNAQDITGLPSVDDIMLSCVPTSSSGYECILNGSSTEKGACLPVPAHWSQWTNWTQCSDGCTSTSQLRQRICVDPLPFISGGCAGESQEIQQCNLTCLVTFKRKTVEGWEDGTKGILCLSSSSSLLLGSSIQYVMLHFSNVTIPKGVTIHSASLQFTAKASATASFQANVRAVVNHEQASQNVFETCSFSMFVFTNASQLYAPGNWENESSGSKERVENLASVVQEVISDQNWQENQSIIIALTSITTSWYRYAYSVDGDAMKAPTLTVVYEKPLTQASSISWNWTEWTPWANCSHDCFTGQRNRSRICQSSNGNIAADPTLICGNLSTQEEFCNTQPCVDASNCTKALDSNHSIACCMLNIPMINGTIYNDCILSSSETYRCPLNRFGNSYGDCIPLNGDYSTWSGWSNCTHECFTGNSYRNRTCNNPSPKYGGLPCNGSDIEQRSCNTHSCYDLSTCTKAVDSNGSVSCCMLEMPLENGTIYDDCILNGNLRYVCPLDRFGITYGECVAVNGNFSEWSPWSNCSHDCFTGYSYRNRTCDNPLPKYGGLSCYGSRTDKRTCNTHSCNDSSTCTQAKNSNGSLSCCMLGMPLSNGYTYNDCILTSNNKFICPLDRFSLSYGECITVNGNFSSWSSWSSCTHNCFTGHSYRNRTCDSPSPKYGGLPCNGSDVENITCNTHSCYDPSNCTLAVGSASALGCCMLNMPLFNQHIYNECVPVFGNNYGCPMDRFNYTFGTCMKVNGKYSQWSQWSDCNQNCIKNRTRLCNKPAPKYGGSPCVGPDSNEAICSNTTCLASINCTHAMDSYGNYRCCIDNCILIQFQNVQVYQCSIGESYEGGTCLPVNGNWTAWSQWSECNNNTSCEKQLRHRYRECTNPKPLYFGTPCQGPSNQTQSCGDCSSDYLGYSEWSAWTSCSKSCGNGTRMRLRECQNSTLCNGALNMSSVCINQQCEVYVGWSNWSSWTACDRSCGGGLKYSYRTCFNANSDNNLYNCDGNAIRQEDCNLHICPVHGKWSQWSEWSLCDKPCNYGTRKRVRFCDSPVPQYGGSDCVGDNNITMSCNKHKCKPVSLNVTVRFRDEVFSNELFNRSSVTFNNLKERIVENITALYGSSNHVIKLDIIYFRPGSVKASFKITFNEISTTEVIMLSSYIDEKNLLWKMPVDEYNLETNEVPPSPNRISAIGSSPTSLELHWGGFSSLMYGYTITGYLITYRKTTDFSEKAWMRLATLGNQTSCNILHLEPYVLYTVRVTAMLNDSLGLPSPFVDVYTSQGVPAKPPKNFSCQALSSSSIFCEWGNIPLESVNGELIGYQLHYHAYDLRRTHISGHNSQWQHVSVDGATSSVVILGLKPFTRYEIEIHGKTNAGHGLGEWRHVKTDEDVPSSPPSNITAQSYKSDRYIDIFWDPIPKENWNGQPVAIILSYTITRRGHIVVNNGKPTKMLLQPDKRHHRIQGLQANLAVSFSLAGSTNAGEGISSEIITAETCSCKKNIYCAWYEKRPYVFLNTSLQVDGIFPSFLKDIVSSVCGTCSLYVKPVLHFDRGPKGQSSQRLSKGDLKSKLSHNFHFHFPAFGARDQTLYEGDYQYVNVIDSVSSVFVVVDKKKASKTKLMFNVVMQSFPILIVITVLVILSGIVIWFADQCKNPDELKRGKFISGVSNGAWWAFITMTTVGYGDIAPKGFFGRIITVAWTVVGIVMTSVFISTLSTAITAVTMNENPRLYGTKVAAVYNSSEYMLGVRRWAIMNSTGKNYSDTKDVLKALVSRKVTGVLLERNEAISLQKYLSDNSLRISQEIQSSTGLGIILSGEMVGLHSHIRAYVEENPDLIKRLISGEAALRRMEVALSSDQVQPTGFFDRNSIEFRRALFYLLILLAVLIFLGCSCSFSKKLFKVLNRKIRPMATVEQQRVIDDYNVRCDALMNIVDDFVKDSEKRITNLYEEHGKQRFSLLLKHCETTPFGPPAWVKHKTIDSKQIMSTLTKDEIVYDSLIRKPIRKLRNKLTSQSYPSPVDNDVQLFDLELISDEEL